LILKKYAGRKSELLVESVSALDVTVLEFETAVKPLEFPNILEKCDAECKKIPKNNEMGVEANHYDLDERPQFEQVDDLDEDGGASDKTKSEEVKLSETNGETATVDVQAFKHSQDSELFMFSDPAPEKVGQALIELESPIILGNVEQGDEKEIQMNTSEPNFVNPGLSHPLLPVINQQNSNTENEDPMTAVQESSLSNNQHHLVSAFRNFENSKDRIALKLSMEQLQAAFKSTTLIDIPTSTEILRIMLNFHQELVLIF
jgi:hypothetical protein